ncbi:MAG: hypothetical protein V4675_14405 [Verrucomicrobiota bacterium]
MKMIRVWAAHDGVAAGAYAEKLLSESPGQFDRSTYLMPWLMHDPVDAVEWLDANAEANPEIYDRADAMFFQGQGAWAVENVPVREAVELTLNLQDPVVRNPFVSGLYQAYSRKQPEVLAGLAPLLQVEDHAQPLSVAHVLTAWRRKDEPAAAAWVRSLPDGDLKTAALGSLARPLPAKP